MQRRQNPAFLRNLNTRKLLSSLKKKTLAIKKKKGDLLTFRVCMAATADCRSMNTAKANGCFQEGDTISKRYSYMYNIILIINAPGKYMRTDSDQQ